jgi:hypothetical protein
VLSYSESTPRLQKDYVEVALSNKCRKESIMTRHHSNKRRRKSCRLTASVGRPFARQRSRRPRSGACRICRYPGSFQVTLTVCESREEGQWRIAEASLENWRVLGRSARNVSTRSGRISAFSESRIALGSDSSIIMIAQRDTGYKS